jgi:hypothetical protein
MANNNNSNNNDNDTADMRNTYKILILRPEEKTPIWETCALFVF